MYALDEIGDAFGEPTEPEKTNGFEVLETISKGDRHDQLYRFLRSQKARNVPLDVALAGCHALNEKCDPPIEKQALDAYLRRVWDQPNAPEFDSKSTKTCDPLHRSE